MSPSNQLPNTFDSTGIAESQSKTSFLVCLHWVLGFLLLPGQGSLGPLTSARVLC